MNSADESSQLLDVLPLDNNVYFYLVKAKGSDNDKDYVKNVKAVEYAFIRRVEGLAVTVHVPNDHRNVALLVVRKNLAGKFVDQKDYVLGQKTEFLIPNFNSHTENVLNASFQQLYPPPKARAAGKHYALFCDRETDVMCYTTVSECQWDTKCSGLPEDEKCFYKSPYKSVWWFRAFAGKFRWMGQVWTDILVKFVFFSFILSIRETEVLDREANVARKAAKLTRKKAMLIRWFANNWLYHSKDQSADAKVRAIVVASKQFDTLHTFSRALRTMDRLYLKNHAFVSSNRKELKKEFRKIAGRPSKRDNCLKITMSSLFNMMVPSKMPSEMFVKSFDAEAQLGPGLLVVSPKLIANLKRDDILYPCMLNVVRFLITPVIALGLVARWSYIAMTKVLKYVPAFILDVIICIFALLYFFTFFTIILLLHFIIFPIIVIDVRHITSMICCLRKINVD